MNLGKHRVPCLLLPSTLDAYFGTPYARSASFDTDNKAFDWAIVTAEDLGERIQALAIAMAELVGVEEVDRGAEP